MTGHEQVQLLQQLQALMNRCQCELAFPVRQHLDGAVTAVLQALDAAKVLAYNELADARELRVPAGTLQTVGPGQVVLAPGGIGTGFPNDWPNCTCSRCGCWVRGQTVSLHPDLSDARRRELAAACATQQVCYACYREPEREEAPK